jgi:hypothetical protein
VENEKKPVSSPSAPSNWASYKEISSLLRSQWPKYLVDVLVIILSITISFTFDGFKEESSRKASEQAYLKALTADITSDISELTRVISATNNVINKANWLLSLSDNPKEIKIDEFATAIKNVMERPNFVSKDATFSDLTSSGNMLLLEDINLKAMLFEYHRLYESVRAVETSERETVNTSIAPYLMKNFSIKGLRKGAKSSVVHQGVNIEQLIQQDDFSNIFSLRLVNRSELLEAYQQELVMAEKIKVTLASKISL